MSCDAVVEIRILGAAPTGLAAAHTGRRELSVIADVCDVHSS